MKTLKETSTHKAVRKDDVIQIIEKGIEDDPSFPDEVIDEIPAENEDDLFAIFERLEENLRCLIAEFNSCF